MFFFFWSLYTKLGRKEEDWQWKKKMMNSRRRRFAWECLRHNGSVFTMLVAQWSKGIYSLESLWFELEQCSDIVFACRYHYNVADMRLAQHIEKGNEDGLFISSVASSSSLWALIMDAGTGFSAQVYELSPLFLHKVCYAPTSVVYLEAYSNKLCCIVAIPLANLCMIQFTPSGFI